MCPIYTSPERLNTNIRLSDRQKINNSKYDYIIQEIMEWSIKFSKLLHQIYHEDHSIHAFAPKSNGERRIVKRLFLKTFLRIIILEFIKNMRLEPLSENFYFERDHKPKKSILNLIYYHDVYTSFIHYNIEIIAIKQQQ